MLGGPLRAVLTLPLLLALLPGCPHPPVTDTEDAAAPGDAGLLPDGAVARDSSVVPDASPRLDAGPGDAWVSRDGAAAPDAAGGADAWVQPPVWVVHVSDTHAGQSSTVAAALSMVLEQVVAVVGPAAVLHSGDLVDEGGEDGQWAAYRAAVDGRAAYPTYMEIPGNHDMKSDGRSKYLAQSVTGRAGGGLYGDTVLETPGGRLRVVRTNTADSDTNVLNLAGVFSQEQLDALLALPPRHARYTVVLGHHPVVGLQRMASPGSTGRMEQLLSSTWADLYLCGHTHTPSLDWAGSTLSVRADSLGHTDPPAWVLLGLDDNGPSAREVAGTPWPLVLVTSPADGSLAGGNPRARPVANPVRVRALAFSPTGVAVVEARVDSGPWQALVAAGTALWAGEVAASPGAHAVTVRASDGQGTDTHRVVVTVAQ